MRTTRSRIQRLGLLAVPLLLSLICWGATGGGVEGSITRVACVGDSITFGSFLADRESDSYPAQLGSLLGSQWEVRNFGVSGATMMAAGNKPYVQRPEYTAALDYKPDVVIIALGTNDSKPVNIDNHPESFTPSYEQMIAAFRQVNPRVRILVCLPPPAFAVNFSIRETTIAGTIIPQIRAVAGKAQAAIIDLHTAMLSAGAMFPDGIHPNPAGASLLARQVFQALVSPTAQTMSGKRVLWLGDSITQQGDYVTFVSYFLNKEFPQSQVDVVSIGLSSETVSGLSEKDHPFPRPNLEERLDRALQLFKPDVVIACYGMNDGIYHPPETDRMQAFQSGIQNLVKQVKAAGAQLVLLTPPPFDSRSAQNTRPANAAQFGYKTPFDGYDAVLTAYARWELSLPASDVRVIDLHTSMARYVEQHRQSKPEFTLTRDGVHPNQLGHLLMAKAILKALGARGPDDGELDAPLGGILADPLYPLVKRLRETRSTGWLPYVGYTREQKTKTNSISDTEKSVSDLQKEIDTLRRANAGQTPPVPSQTTMPLRESIVH